MRIQAARFNLDSFLQVFMMLRRSQLTAVKVSPQLL
jgi:hypothetical protein